VRLLDFSIDLMLNALVIANFAVLSIELPEKIDLRQHFTLN